MLVYLCLDAEMIPSKQKLTHHYAVCMCDLYSHGIAMPKPADTDSQCLFFFQRARLEHPITKEKRTCHTTLMRNHVINFEVKYNCGTLSP